MAGLKGIALVSLVEPHSLDPVASHASLREGDVVSNTVERLDGGCTVKCPEVQIGKMKSFFFC